MSVPVPQRRQGELEVNTKARALTVYTLMILENEKWFPKSQSAFIDMIRNCAIEIQSLCWEANNIKAKRGECTRESVDSSWATWIDHLSKGNTYKLIQRLNKYYKEPWE